MERGPMALFGAIVAIGLGPAMWLGAQFGDVTLSPERPPAVSSVRNDVEAPQGGTGAGNTPTDTIRTEPKADTEPLTRTRNARPAPTRSATPSPDTSQEPSTPPDDPALPDAPDPGPGKTTPPPVESSSAPAEPPVEDEDPDVPSQPAEPDTDAESDPIVADGSLL